MSLGTLLVPRLSTAVASQIPSRPSAELVRVLGFGRTELLLAENDANAGPEGAQRIDRLLRVELGAFPRLASSGW